MAARKTRIGTRLYTESDLRRAFRVFDYGGNVTAKDMGRVIRGIGRDNLAALREAHRRDRRVRGYDVPRRGALPNLVRPDGDLKRPNDFEPRMRNGEPVRDAQGTIRRLGLLSPAQRPAGPPPAVTRVTPTYVTATYNVLTPRGMPTGDTRTDVFSTAHGDILDQIRDAQYSGDGSPGGQDTLGGKGYIILSSTSDL